MSAPPRVTVVPTAEALAELVADRVEEAAGAGAPGGRVAIALAGGETPRAAYRVLAGRTLPWEHLDVLFGDERCVGSGEPGTNHAMAAEALLHRVPLPPGRIHRIPGELGPEEAARRAEADVRRSVAGDPPELDLVLLGLGEDGHTASLFPGDPALGERRRLMVPVHRPGLRHPRRVSMTLPLLDAARRLVVMAAGASKAPAAARAVAGDAALPAGRLRPARGSVEWILTEDAAAELPGRGPPPGATAR